MTATNRCRLLTSFWYLSALVAMVAGCTGAPVASPTDTVTPTPSPAGVSTPSSTAEPGSTDAVPTSRPTLTPLPSTVAIPTSEPTIQPSAGAPTTSPDDRCGRPSVDPTVELTMDAQILDEADMLTSAVPFDGGLLVAGWLDESAGGKAAIWRSNDGTSWEQFESDALGTAHIWDLLETNTGLLAVGGDLGPSDLGDARIWSSTDGISWQPVEAPAFELGGQYGSAFRIAEGGPGYVVVGSQHTFSEVNVVVWLSSDGVTWEVAPPIDAFDSALPTSMLVRDDGLIVVGISICDEDGCTNGAVLTSTDGREWARHRESGGAAESTTPALHALVQAGATDILGVGTSYEDVPLVEVDDVASGVWRSADGLIWEVAPGPERGRALTVADGRFLVSGSWGAECQKENPSVWLSGDGRDWLPAWVSADGGTIERMSSWDGRLVMIGRVPDFVEQVFRSVVWIESR